MGANGKVTVRERGGCRGALMAVQGLGGPILHDRAPEILDECPEVCVYNYPLIPGVGT